MINDICNKSDAQLSLWCFYINKFNAKSYKLQGTECSFMQPGNHFPGELLITLDLSRVDTSTVISSRLLKTKTQP